MAGDLAVQVRTSTVGSGSSISDWVQLRPAGIGLAVRLAIPAAILGTLAVLSILFTRNGVVGAFLFLVFLAMIETVGTVHALLSPIRAKLSDSGMVIVWHHRVDVAHWGSIREPNLVTHTTSDKNGYPHTTQQWYVAYTTTSGRKRKAAVTGKFVEAIQKFPGRPGWPA